MLRELLPAVRSFCLIAACLIVSSVATADDANPIDFARDIKPILQARCYECHGAETQEAGLRLDFSKRALAGGDSGKAIVAGKSGESPLVHRIAGNDPEKIMPPDGEPLSAEQVTLITAWIDQGASWPESADEAAGIRSTHWAYQPLADVAPPLIDDAWIQSPIDAFVLAKLREQGIEPSPAADRRMLIRRLSLDLLGLPPEPEAVEAFVNDSSPDAYENLVDSLLASVHFGERWGRHWLDMARYADSDGYEKDNPRPDAWRWRNWVIDAVNADMPFDQFTIEQLAGDLLPDADPMQRLATAFHRQTLTNTEGGTDQEQWRVEAVFDRVETTGAVWLGLTVGCARCHTHKYDQITQREYYELFAFFNNGDETTAEIPISPLEVERYQREKPPHDAMLAEAEKALADAFASATERYAAWEKQTNEAIAAATPDTKLDSIAPKAVRAILAVEADKRTDEQKTAIRDHFARTDAELTPLKTKLDEVRAAAPKSPYVNARIIAQRTEKPRTTHVLRRGDFLSPLEPVDVGTLDVLPEMTAGADSPRLALARWLVSTENPLTPRVTVNHIWMHLFGTGLVRTVNDFGVRGEQPTHPELLDWLAREFPRLGWSRKALIKEIVMSSTYRQASTHRLDLAEIDPENRLLARQNRFRIEAELIRDLSLAASGLLSRKVGGPSVFPPLPPDVAALSYANNFKWTASEGEDRYRRGMYTFFKRTAPHPNLVAFDCPDANTATIARATSNTPLQALTTLNEVTFVEAAEAFAKRLLSISAETDAARIGLAFEIALSRSPSDAETDQVTELLAAARGWFGVHPDEAQALTSQHRADGATPAEAAAWTVVARTLLNLDEFITRE